VLPTAGIARRPSAAAHIASVNVIKVLLRFETRWWTTTNGSGRSDSCFDKVRLVDARHQAEQPVLTGLVWSPKTDGMVRLIRRASRNDVGSRSSASAPTFLASFD